MKTQLMLGLFGQEPGDCGTHEMLVEVRDGKIYHAEMGELCKIVGEAEVKGWGELVNGPAYRVDYGSLDIALVPKREWDRVLSGKKERTA